MRQERVESRVLGAIRLLDATTGVRIPRPLHVRGSLLRLFRNRGGAYVMAAAPGLDAHTASFAQPPATPALESVPLALCIRDPAGYYLSRRAVVRLPRDADPDRASQARSLFRLVDVRLFPAPTARTALSWAVVRATVVDTTRNVPLPGALIRAVRTRDGAHLASGLSDGRGEALVAVPGIPITTWETGPGPVLATEVDVTLEVIFDPVADALPDPDDLEQRHPMLRLGSTPVTLASGRTQTLLLSVARP